MSLLFIFALSPFLCAAYSAEFRATITLWEIAGWCSFIAFVAGFIAYAGGLM